MGPVGGSCKAAQVFRSHPDTEALLLPEEEAMACWALRPKSKKDLGNQVCPQLSGTDPLYGAAGGWLASRTSVIMSGEGGGAQACPRWRSI